MSPFRVVFLPFPRRPGLSASLLSVAHKSFHIPWGKDEPFLSLPAAAVGFEPTITIIF